MDNVFAIRLKNARLMAGLSLQQLSDKLNNKVSKQAISKYEKGEMKPNSGLLIDLANALDVKPVYFLRPMRVILQGIEFRKKSTLNTHELNTIKEKVKDYLERYIEIEEHLGIEQRFVNPIASLKIKKIEDVEKAVKQLRNEWSLGLNPIGNISELLENKGFKIIEISASKKFDGLSSIFNDIPVLVVNEINDIVRKRFTILHELGHVLLNIDKDTESKEVEHLCNYFAGSFLLPMDVCFEKLGRQRKGITFKELISIKEYYGISLQAIFYRAKELNIVSENTAKSFWIKISQNKEEVGLGEYKGKEHSDRFSQLVYRAYSEDLISQSKVAELLNISLVEFKQNLTLV